MDWWCVGLAAILICLVPSIAVIGSKSTLPVVHGCQQKECDPVTDPVDNDGDDKRLLNVHTVRMCKMSVVWRIFLVLNNQE